MGLYKQQRFEQMPVIGILRNIPLTAIEAFLPSYKSAGFTMLEVTMNSEGAEEIIHHLSTNHPDLNIGAGTVCDINDLELALNAGASFIVTPIIDNEVMSYCVNHNIPIFPGAFTPLEIYTAAKLGASVVKLFPAGKLGTGYIKDVLAPLNHIKILPTGGVNLENIEEFFKAGAVGVGMGSTLFVNEFIENNQIEKLEMHFKKIAQKVRPFVK